MSKSEQHRVRPRVRGSRQGAGAALLAVALASACADDTTPDDGSVDAPRMDSGTDATTGDAGRPDADAAGGTDATAGDATAGDAARADAMDAADADAADTGLATADVATDGARRDAAPDAGGVDVPADVPADVPGPDASEPEEDGYLPVAMPDSATRRCVSTTTNEVLGCEAAPWRHFGQDGSYLLHVPSYAASADAVRDSVTGLEWQRVVAVHPLDFAGARDLCDALVLAGHDDWRLPSRLELVSLWDLGPGQPSVNVAAFGANVPSPFWSASRAPRAGERWLVYFQQTTGTLPTTEPSRVALARCVRGGARTTGGRFTATDATVRDAVGGLEWSRELSVAATWADSIVQCEGLVLGGQSDWRLPSAKEMLSALSDVRANPAVDPAYFRWSPVTVWTSTPFQVTSSVWGFEVDLASGLSTSVPNRAAVLPHACVRGG